VAAKYKVTSKELDAAFLLPTVDELFPEGWQDDVYDPITGREITPGDIGTRSKAEPLELEGLPSDEAGGKEEIPLVSREAQPESPEMTIATVENYGSVIADILGSRMMGKGELVEMMVEKTHLQEAQCHEVIDRAVENGRIRVLGMWFTLQREVRA